MRDESLLRQPFPFQLNQTYSARTIFFVLVDLLGSTDTASINELFDELIAALLQLIQNSDISATVSTT